MRRNPAYYDDPALVPAADGRTWPCGHPKTEANTQSIGSAGKRCKICRRKISRRHQMNHREAERAAHGRRDQN